LSYFKYTYFEQKRVQAYSEHGPAEHNFMETEFIYAQSENKTFKLVKSEQNQDILINYLEKPCFDTIE